MTGTCNPSRNDSTNGLNLAMTPWMLLAQGASHSYLSCSGIGCNWPQHDGLLIWRPCRFYVGKSCDLNGVLVLSLQLEKSQKGELWTHKALMTLLT